MERFNMTPRSDYREKIEALGFDFHGDYWREEAYYRFTPAEIERLEEATREAYRMYCEAAEYIISEKPDFMERMLQIPAEVCERICESWNRDELSLYGRFDFLLDEKGVPRILEFNADTPTSLLEASVIQWQWKEECFPECDQYNGIHEGLVQSWKDIFPAGSNIHFVGALDDHEDTGTLQYLASTAMEAGYSTTDEDIRILARRKVTVAHCPVSNMKLSSGMAPVQKMLDAGCRVTLATDGCSSNNNLDMREEMKIAALMAKVCSGPQALSAGEVLRMATRAGAETMGLDAGVIEEGRLADLLLVRHDNACMTPMFNPESNWVYAADSSMIDTVICNGRILMQGRKVEGEEDILADARRLAATLL